MTQQRSIEINDVAADALAGEFSLGQCPARLAELAPKRCITCEPLDRAGQRLCVVGRNQEGIDARACDFPTPRHVGRYQRPATGRGFQEAQRQSLAPGGQDRNMGRCPECRDIGDVSEIGEVGPPGPGGNILFGNRAWIGRVGRSGDEEPDFAAAAAQKPVRLDQSADALRPRRSGRRTRS